MTIWKHELRTGRLSLLIWTAAIAFHLAVCIFIYPEMSVQMEEISDTFSQMGSFSQAFGMDQINFGEFIGFFGVECGNVLGLGGALYAALIGISALAKEEKEHTAEFLLTHPVGRLRVLAEKLAAIGTQLFLLNGFVIMITALSIILIGETPDVSTMLLLFLAYFILQLETAAICFGLSAFLHRGSMGLGLGVAGIFYILNLIANLTEEAACLKYLTPFGYAEGTNIIADGSLNGAYLAVGILLAATGIFVAFFRYSKKDIV